MIDKAGAAAAAAEPVAHAQSDGVASSADETSRQPAPPIERSKETARASVDRAFAALEQPAVAVDTKEQGEAAQNQRPGEGDDEQIASQDNTAEPPARFSAEAKSAWAEVPDTVRAETHRALKEMNEGLDRYQAMVEPLKPYQQLAEKFGTTIQDTLGRYVALDFALLSKQPEERMSAIERVLGHAGTTPRDYAAFVMGQKPAETQPDEGETIRGLRQEITDLRDRMGGMSASLDQRRDDEIGKQVDAFAADNPRLKEPEVQGMIIRLLDSNLARDLKSAYDMAIRLGPEPAKDTQTASNAANRMPVPAQTRNGNLSITGAPGSGSNPVRRNAPKSARESVDNAFASLGLG